MSLTVYILITVAGAVLSIVYILRKRKKKKGHEVHLCLSTITNLSLYWSCRTTPNWSYRTTLTAGVLVLDEQAEVDLEIMPCKDKSKANIRLNIQKNTDELRGLTLEVIAPGLEVKGTETAIHLALSQTTMVPLIVTPRQMGRSTLTLKFFRGGDQIGSMTQEVEVRKRHWGIVISRRAEYTLVIISGLAAAALALAMIGYYLAGIFK